MLISARDLEMPVTEFLVQSNLKILKTYRNIVSGKAVERKSIDVFLKDIKKIEKTQKMLDKYIFVCYSMPERCRRQ